MFGFENVDSRGRNQTKPGVTDSSKKLKAFVSPLVGEDSEIDPFLTFLPQIESTGISENAFHRGRGRASKNSPKATTGIAIPFQLDSSEPKLRTNRRGRLPSSRNNSFGTSPSAESSGSKLRPAAEYSGVSAQSFRFPSPTERSPDIDDDYDNDVSKVEENLAWAINTAPALFWRKFSNGAKDNDDWKKFDAVYRAATSLATDFLHTVDSSFNKKSHLKFRCHNFDVFKFLCDNIPGILMSTGFQKTVDPAKIEKIFDTFYTCGFKAMNCLREESLEDENMHISTRVSDMEECETCGESVCVCCKIVSLFHQANRALQGLGLMEELAGPRVYSVISKEMAQRVDETCSGKYETSHIEDLTDWLKYRVLPWIEIVYPDSTIYTSINRHDEFSQLLLEVYGKAIINEMFSIIIEFPDSQPILEDLRTCMHQANLRNILVTKLKWALERRLLNAGVSTNSVLDAYCNCVKALKFVDASGILVQLITPPVREYLKHREETVRVILVSLTEESGDLAEELSRNPTYTERRARLCGHTWNEWKPDPIDVPRDKFNLRKSDLIQALVSIYGSKSLFIDEYRALLADRLLRMAKPGPITREIKCLELLKLRFGDSNLQKCEVMLKDVSDSQRLNTRFYEDEGAVLADEDVVVTGLVVSAQFWPSFKQETLKLPPVVASAFEKYTKAFETIKGNRTLEWQSHVGTVDIELESDGTTLEFSCTPSQAAIIYHFSQNEMWNIDELAESVGMSTAVLENRIGFWTSKGVISENPKGSYRLHESFADLTGTTQQSSSKYAEDAEADFPLTSTSRQRENELQVFWSYIEGMLTNLESLPLARIHSMLKLFTTVECSIEAVQKFLDEKVSQNLLAYSGGQYQLPK